MLVGAVGYFEAWYTLMYVHVGDPVKLIVIDWRFTCTKIFRMFLDLWIFFTSKYVVSEFSVKFI